MESRILVTGGAGYIGSVVADLLVRQGHRVTILDNLTHGHALAAPPGAELIGADLSHRASLEAVFARGQFDAVVHFAALIEAGESMRAPELYFRNNTASTLTLFESMLAHNVKKFVFSSTAALYGNPERTPIEEDAPLHPTNAYGESKLLVERMLEWFHRIHNFRYASLRYFNVAGAWENHGEDHRPETHLIPNVLQVALGKKGSIAIFGDDYPTPDGTCIRDYIHIHDLARAHLLALDALDRRDHMIYNLGNGKGFSVRQVIEAARRVTGHPIPAGMQPRRPGDPAVLVASSEKIYRELNWSPEFATLDAIIASAWVWHKAHPEGYGERE
jgi:UDP-glucose 4-epimerase